MQKDNTNQNAEHATIDQLLDYLGKASGELNKASGEDISAVAIHIESCSHCQAELNVLSSIGPTIFNHIDEPPSDQVWQKLQASLYDDDRASSQPSSGAATDFKQNNGPIDAGSANVHTLRPSPYQSLSKAIYALAASVAFVGVIAAFMFSQQQSSNQQTLLMQASINELMINSRGLEQSLQAVAQQSRALSEANQRAADRLYWKLTYVDQLIHEVAPEDSERVKTLWNDRVDALNELKQIYFERDSARETSQI